MQADQLLKPSTDVVAREVGDDFVLLHLGTGTYFGLDPVGGRIWRLLEDAARTQQDLAGAIAAEYAVQRDEVAQDIAALIANLLEHGLVEAA